MKVNAYIAFKEPAYVKLRQATGAAQSWAGSFYTVDDYEALLDGTYTDDILGVPAWVVRGALDMRTQDSIDMMGKRPTIGGDRWVLTSWYIDEFEEAQWVVNLLSAYPTKVVMIAAYKQNGLQVGEFFGPDGEVLGSPRYPVHPRAAEFLADQVTHDENGVETSRVSPTRFRPPVVLEGQQVRD